MKLLFSGIFIFCFSFFGTAQPTYYNKIHENGIPSVQYIHPEDSVLNLEFASKSDSGNTFIIIGVQRGSSALYKIDSLGKSSYAPLSAGYHGTLGRERAAALHSTPDGGCIFAKNHDITVAGPTTRTYVSKIDSSCQIQWDILLPSVILSGYSYQTLFDIGLLPNYHYACLCENYIYILDSLGIVTDSLNFQGPGTLIGFPNGDLFVNTNTFKGRIDINGSTIWQTNDSILCRDTILVALRNDTLHFLNSMTGLTQSTVPFTQNGDSKVLLTKDGGWCTYNSNRIHRYDQNGQLKWLENVHLPHFGMNLISEQANGSLLTGGTYLYEKCMYNEYDFSSFIGTIDTTGKSVMDSTYQVWPGDANDDNFMEFSDVIYIALAQRSTGPSRLDTSIVIYNTFYCSGDISTNFPGNFAIGINHQQCDAATNGIIDSVDIVEFANYTASFNRSMTTPWRTGNPDEHKSSRVLPYFSLLPERDTVNAGDSIRVYIEIGGNGIAIDSIFGIAFSLIVDTTYTNSVINYNTVLLDSRLGLQNDLQFYHWDFGSPFAAFMTARKDLQNAYMVHDTIGYLELYIDTSISQNMDINFVVTSFKAITASGFPVDFQYDIHPIHANRLTTNISEKVLEQIQFFPNPAFESIKLNHLPPVDLSIRIYNEQGRECYFSESEKAQEFLIHVNNFHSGMYFLKVSHKNDQFYAKKFVIQ